LERKRSRIGSAFKERIADAKTFSACGVKLKTNPNDIVASKIAMKFSVLGGRCIPA